MRKKIVIATLNDYIVYQPTILNLYDRLKEVFDVEIISFEPEYISKQKDFERNVKYLKVPQAQKHIVQKFDFLINKLQPLIIKVFPRFKYHYKYYNYLLPSVLKKALRNIVADYVISVDIPALSICQEVFGDVHFLSLEIDISDPYLKKIDITRIKSVFIQNIDRVKYLLPEYKGPVFIVQNAPPYIPMTSQVEKSTDFVWAGTLVERFGIFDCLDFFTKHPEYRIVLKGGADKSTLQKVKSEYSEWIKKGVIELNNAYLPSDEFVRFLSRFKIGFCFYSWDLINSNFNYRTAPSGKLFMYMAAGVPVIACKIPGFDFIDKFRAGVLIEDYSTESILKAVKTIEEDYEEYQKACFKVAEHFDFNKDVTSYIEFLSAEM